MQITESELRTLIRRWVLQANHPMRSNMPEAREAILKCAEDLSQLLHRKHLEETVRPPIQFPKTTL